MFDHIPAFPVLEHELEVVLTDEEQQSEEPSEDESQILEDD